MRGAARVVVVGVGMLQVACASAPSSDSAASSLGADPCGEASRAYRCLEASQSQALLDPETPETHPPLKLVALLRDARFVSLVADGRLSVDADMVDYSQARYRAETEAQRYAALNNLGVAAAAAGALNAALAHFVAAQAQEAVDEARSAEANALSVEALLAARSGQMAASGPNAALPAATAALLRQNLAAIHVAYELVGNAPAALQLETAFDQLVVAEEASLAAAADVNTASLRLAHFEAASAGDANKLQNGLLYYRAIQNPTAELLVSDQLSTLRARQPGLELALIQADFDVAANGLSLVGRAQAQESYGALMSKVISGTLRDHAHSHGKRGQLVQKQRYEARARAAVGQRIELSVAQQARLRLARQLEQQRGALGKRRAQPYPVGAYSPRRMGALPLKQVAESMLQEPPLSTTAPTRSGGGPSAVIDAGAVQVALGGQLAARPGANTVEYVGAPNSGGSTVIARVLAADGSEVREIPIVDPETGEAMDAQALFREATDARRAMLDQISRGYVNHARRMGALLVQPIWPYLEKSSKTIIYANFLSSLPFAALQLDAGLGEQVYFGSVMPLALGVGGEVLDDAAIPFSGEAAAVGDFSHFDEWVDLPQTREEVANIAGQGFGSPLIDEQVTVDAMLEAFAAPRSAVHLATHGRWEPADGGRSGGNEIVLSTQLLSPADVVTAPSLSASLLFLNMCESGTYINADSYAPDLTDQGVLEVALSRGVPRGIVTFWKVDDVAAMRIATAFYTFLRQDSDVTRALMRARQEVLGQGRYNHPYFWASHTEVVS